MFGIATLSLLHFNLIDFELFFWNDKSLSDIRAMVHRTKHASLVVWKS